MADKKHNAEKPNPKEKEFVVLPSMSKKFQPSSSSSTPRNLSSIYQGPSSRQSFSSSSSTSTIIKVLDPVESRLRHLERHKSDRDKSRGDDYKKKIYTEKEQDLIDKIGISSFESILPKNRDILLKWIEQEIEAIKQFCESGKSRFYLEGWCNPALYEGKPKLTVIFAHREHQIANLTHLVEDLKFFVQGNPKECDFVVEIQPHNGEAYVDRQYERKSFADFCSAKEKGTFNEQYARNMMTGIRTAIIFEGIPFDLFDENKTIHQKNGAKIVLHPQIESIITQRRAIWDRFEVVLTTDILHTLLILLIDVRLWCENGDLSSGATNPRDMYFAARAKMDIDLMSRQAGFAKDLKNKAGSTDYKVQGILNAGYICWDQISTAMKKCTSRKAQLEVISKLPFENERGEMKRVGKTVAESIYKGLFGSLDVITTAEAKVKSNGTKEKDNPKETREKKEKKKSSKDDTKEKNKKTTDKQKENEKKKKESSKETTETKKKKQEQEDKDGVKQKTKLKTKRNEDKSKRNESDKGVTKKRKAESDEEAEETNKNRTSKKAKKD